MKYFFLTVILSSLIYFSHGQKTADELKKDLNDSKYDTAKVLISHQLCDLYMFSKPDSSLQFAEQALELSKTIGFDLGEARSVTRVGNILKSAGDFPKALETHLQALKLYEKLNDQVGIAASYNNMAEVFKEQHDFKQALSYYFKTQVIFEAKIKNVLSSQKNNTSVNKDEEIKYKKYLATTLLNIGDAYERMNMLDSALIFQNQAYEIANIVNDKNNLGAILSNLGSIQMKKGNIDLALSFFKTGVPIMTEINDQQFLSNTYHGMAQAFDKKKMSDSAIHYGKLALAAATEGSFQKEMLNADTLLARLFELEKKYDSALYYTKLGRNIADSIATEEKIRQVQNLQVTEQLRQNEIAAAQAKEEKDRIDNLQLFAIAIFIVVFFITLIFISRRKTKPRSLEYLGLVGLLLLFEFITVFIHPYIGNFTHHTPVYILLVSVGIAMLLTPLHHRLTTWIKLKFAKKHRKTYSKKAKSVKPLRREDKAKTA